MMVGIDSYLSLAEADAYITGHYRSNNAARIRWAALSDPDKEVLLLNACAELEQLPFQGRKAIIDQPMAWPRLPMQYGVSQEVPQGIKSAQAELALWLSDDEQQEEAARRRALREQGVAGFSLGDLSESYTSGAKPGNIALECPKATALLLRYLSGGYATC